MQLVSIYFYIKKLLINKKGDSCMENITMDEVERKLNDKEMEKIFKRICTYFNKNESLIKKFKKK